jgi:plastocyanin
MRSIDRSPTHTGPMLLAILAALILVLGACTGTGSGATAESSASAEESAEASTAESMEESAEASEGGGEGQTVTLTGFAFDTDEITVSAGDTVTFVNEDSAAHTVTEGVDGNAADDASFDEQVAAGESVEVTFDEAGDVNVTCLFHSQMNMVVHVE